MRLTCAQLNPIIGDILGNTRLIIDAIHAHALTTDLIVFSELVISGYPPQDLLDYNGFIESVEEAISHICDVSRGYPTVGIVIGAPVRFGHRLTNNALFILNGTNIGSQAKTLLPFYDVFDETRYFVSGTHQPVISFGGYKIGLSICEDAWAPPYYTTHDYTTSPIQTLSTLGADLIVNISASPFETTKPATRYHLFQSIARDLACPVVVVNQVGAHDELIFDGHSMVFDSHGHCILQLKGFESDIQTVDLSKVRDASHPLEPLFPSAPELSACAIRLGLRDYCRKTGFSQVLLGLSGGIDSAVVAVLAQQALGAESVLGIALPSEYSSPESVEDAEQLAKTLGIEFQVLPIHSMVTAFKQSVHDVIPDNVNPDGTLQPRVVFENTQARIRGLILMGISNDQNRLLLTTGNKSELSVGYCTLYGDMCGGLNIIADLYKGQVYELARYLNRDQEIIPSRILTKAPSAELRPNQTDQDSLPDYEVLDQVLTLYNEEQKTMNEIIQMGFDASLIQHVIGLVHRHEYKRAQAAPGLKLSTKAFGKGRRMPIAARYRFTTPLPDKG